MKHIAAKNTVNRILERVFQTLLVAFVLVGASGLAQNGTTSILDIIDTEDDLTTFASLIRSSGLYDELAHSGSYTLFAPTNAAFANVPASTLQTIANDPNALKGVLSYHIVPGALVASNVRTGRPVSTLFGEDLNLTGATLLASDLMGINGVVHLLDRVMIPNSLAIGNPETLEDIVSVLASDPQFSTLFTAVQAAGLTDVLRNGTFTVFAPTNDAFAKVPRDQLNQLLANPNALRNLLTYHVFVGTATQRDLANFSNRSAATVQGNALGVNQTGGRIVVNGATVVSPDIIASNGVVQGIDTVLTLPQ